MADETCPYCKEPLPEPRPTVCPNCAETIEQAESGFPIRLLLGFAPSALIGLSPLYSNWIMGPDYYGIGVLILDILVLMPITLIYVGIWAYFFRRDKPVQGSPWMLLGSLMFFLNCALGFGGCLAVLTVGEAI